MTHVEIIKPSEKLSGYLPPSRPVTLVEVDEAIVAANAAGLTIPGVFVLKVARGSVSWKKPARTRRLKFADGACACAVIGSNRDWWFVSVNRSEKSRAPAAPE